MVMRPSLSPASSFIAFFSRTHPSHNSCARSLSTQPISSLRARGHDKLNARVACGRRASRAFHASSSVSATSRDPYKVLGVQKDATAAEIKKTYFALARKYHPDTNQDKGARDKFVEIQEAYDTLKDDTKRAAYDQYGAASQQPGFDPKAFSRAQGSFGGGFGGFSNLGDLFGSGRDAGRARQSDMFEELFGTFATGAGRSRGSMNMKGADVEASVGITFMDACKGTFKTVTIHPVVECHSCTGTGLKQGAKRTVCNSCGGSGTRTFVIDSGFQMASTCGTCGGVGSTVPSGSQCGTCHGGGRIKKQKNVEVNIPPGVEDGMTIRVPGEGDGSISGQKAGDLLLHVHVAPSKIFTRQGANLYHEARIPLQTAVLGGRVRIPTLDGEVDVRVPGGTQHGEEMVLKGRGVPPVYGSGKGDLFVAFAVQLPRSLSKRQREIFQEFADEVEGKSPKADSSRDRTSDQKPNFTDGNKNDLEAHNQTSARDEDLDRGKKRRATA